MRRTSIVAPTSAAALCLAVALGGCDRLNVLGDDDENEVRVTIEALGAASLDADDGIRYRVDDGTEYEGLTGFADLSVGDVVEIEYDEIAGSDERMAREIEADGAEDDD